MLLFFVFVIDYVVKVRIKNDKVKEYDKKMKIICQNFENSLIWYTLEVII